MKNKPMLQNLSSTGNLGLWTVQNTAIQKTEYLLHTKRCARFGLFKLIWENIKNTTSCIYIYIPITIPADRFLANRKVNMPVLAFTKNAQIQKFKSNNIIILQIIILRAVSMDWLLPRSCKMWLSTWNEK